MKKDFKQFTAGTSGDHNYHFAADIGGKKVLVLNNIFRKTSEINISKAFIELDGASTATNVSVYWDSTGALTDYSNLDNDAVKLDFTTNIHSVARFDVTKALATILKENDLQRNERYIIVGNNIPISEISCSISIYYDYKCGFRERNAIVPFELKNASGSIDLSDSSMRMSFVVNNGYGRIPASVKYYYDSNLSTEMDKIYLDNDQYEQINYRTGRGWKINYNQYVVSEKSNNFMSDGESVGFFTWINAQGNHIIFAEKFYATINFTKVFLKLSQLDVDAQGNYTYTLDDVTYSVVHDYECRQLFKLKEVVLSSTEKKIEITDLTDNKMSFEQTSMATHNGVVIYRLNKIEDSYANTVNINYNTSGWLTQIDSVGGNTVNVVYDEEGNGLICKIRDMLTVSTYIETVIDSNADWDICQFITPENHRNISFTNYAESNKIKTVLDSIGNGYYFKKRNATTDNYDMEIHSIAENGGIVNGQTVAFKPNAQLELIGTKNYEFVRLYGIKYEGYCSVLTELRNNTSSRYLFDYFGNNTNSYEENYDGEGTGNPQVKSFSNIQKALRIYTENVFTSNDLLIDSTVTPSGAGHETSIGDLTLPENRDVKKYIEKMSTKAGVNQKVYYNSPTNEDKTILFECSTSSINKMKDSDAKNYIISAWVKANSFGIKPYGKGFRWDYTNFEEIPYSKDEEYEVLYNDDETDYNRRHRRFDLCAEVYYSSEDSDNYYDLFSVSFDSENKVYQQLSLPIRLRSDSTFTLLYVKVYVNYRNNNGNVYVYGMSMKSGNFDFQDSNKFKQVETKRTINEPNYFIKYHYNDSQLLIRKAKIPDDGLTLSTFEEEYFYNAKKRMIYSINSENQRIDFSYDSSTGDVTKKEQYCINDTSPIKKITTENAYDSEGNATTKKNNFGEILQVNTFEHGAVVSSTPGIDATINYEYDSSYNLITELSAANNSISQSYLKGENLTQISSGSSYSYDYDGFGRIVAIKIDGSAYCSIEYTNQNQKVVTYANGEKEKIQTSNSDKKCEVYCADTTGVFHNTAIEMKLSSYGTFKELTDEMDGGETKYKSEYDDCGRPLKSVVENKDDSFYDVIIKNEYDTNGRVKKIVYEQQNNDVDIATPTYSDSYSSQVTQLNHDWLDSENQTFDSLKRVATYSKKGGEIVKELSYKTVGNLTSSIVSSEKYIIDENEYALSYTYDVLNRLTEVKENGNIISSYQYDSLGRLSRENNQKLNKTCVYAYDTNGNIQSRTEYEYTASSVLPNDSTVFTYNYDNNHKDLLLGYNGQSVGNYSLGNPRLYRGRTLSWKNVHRLATYVDLTNNLSISYNYNYSGFRTSKTINGVVTKFGVNEDKIISQQVGSDTSSRITFYYGIDGVTGFKSGNGLYYYQKNTFGDIIGIYNDYAELIAKYVYDAWGNHKVLNPDGTENTSTTFIGNINPFRYRSYYFDKETGFYYLQSRYYDPQVGRFISMDAVEYIDTKGVNGLNLYAYCDNCPTMGYDPNGTWNWKKFLITAAIGLVVSTVAVVAAVVSHGEKHAVELAAAVITTSLTASIAAGKEEAFAMDITGEVSGLTSGGKEGATLVFDFTGDGLNVDGYVHQGVERTSQLLGGFNATYSVGYISGYNPEGYKGDFRSLGGSIGKYGFEYAQNSDGSIKQYSASFSLIDENPTPFLIYSGIETYSPRLF